MLETGQPTMKTTLTETAVRLFLDKFEEGPVVPPLSGIGPAGKSPRDWLLERAFNVIVDDDEVTLAEQSVYDEEHSTFISDDY